MFCENSSVGDRPAARGGTTRPDERQIYIKINLSPNLIANCWAIMAQLAIGIVHFLRTFR